MNLPRTLVSLSILLAATSTSQAGVWSSLTPITDDASSGVVSGTYTTAVNLGGGGVTVSGVPFSAGSSSGTGYSLNSHWAGPVTDSLTGVSGNVATLLNDSIHPDHVFGFFSSTVSFSGLSIGTNYLATFYFPGTTASDTLFAGSDALNIPGGLDATKGYYATYLYTASALTQSFTLQFNGSDGVRLAGFSNVAPSAVPEPGALAIAALGGLGLLFGVKQVKNRR